MHENAIHENDAGTESLRGATAARGRYISEENVKRNCRFGQGLRMRIYIPQKITITVKNRLHSRQQPCRSPQQTVIGIGLRELFCQKVRLPSVRAARRHCRCLAFRFFYFILCLFSVYTFFMRNPCRFGVSRLTNRYKSMVLKKVQHNAVVLKNIINQEMIYGTRKCNGTCLQK